MIQKLSAWWHGMMDAMDARYPTAQEDMAAKKPVKKRVKKVAKFDAKSVAKPAKKAAKKTTKKSARG